MHPAPRASLLTTLPFFLLFLPLPTLAQVRDITVEGMRTEKRVALIIGNGAYPTSPLRNPVNDARSMSQALRSLGFQVLSRENLSQKEMRRAIIEFGDELIGGGVGLFYYAGHGLQVNGKNYMIPTDAVIKSEKEVEVESVDVATVLARMETAKNRLNIVMLDACRDNPFGRSFRSSARGLASIDAPSGTIIAYATAPGKLARDGEGPNGLYTSELLKAVQVPGLKIEDVFKRVRQALQIQTRGEQVPWESSSLVGDFMFMLPTVSPPPPEVTVVPQHGSVELRVNVGGARILLDGVDVGRTQEGGLIRVDPVRAGDRRLELKKEGWRDWTKEVRVRAGERTVVDAEMLAVGPPAMPHERSFPPDNRPMVLVPAGEFIMGDNHGDGRADEKPSRRGYLDVFYIDKYPITNEEYRKFMDGTGHRAPEYWDKSNFNGPRQPVVGVSWEDAAAYCKWAGKRLPTEAEWEKAARGPDGRKYPWGNEWDPSKSIFRGNSGSKTHPVDRTYNTHRSAYGAVDMSGNVWQWVADWYDSGYYARGENRNPKGPASGSARVLRGGSWDYEPRGLRAPFRGWFVPSDRGSFIGLRCAGAP